MMRHFFLILLMMLIPAMPVSGAKPRTSKTVRQEKKEATRKIARTQGKIKTNLDDTRRQLAQFESLGAEISASDVRIAALQHTTDSVSARVKELADSVEATRIHVENLKASYAASLRSIRRQRQISSATAFIFSSRTFSEARRRMRYLKELGEWQTGKAADLKEAAAALEAQKQELDSVRARLSADLADLKKQKARLVSARAEADALIAKLRRQGKQLEQALAEQKTQAEKLDEELNRIIEEESRAAAEAERKRKAAEAEAKRKAEEEARRKAEQEAAAKAAAEKEAQANKKKAEKKADKKKPVKPQEKPQPKAEEKPKPTTTPAPAKSSAPVASSFAAAKGKLPMPVSGSAVIVSDFGRHTHKELSKVEVQNNGIDIETTPGASAVAVYPGTVSMVIVMDGYHNVVLVRHGEYLTVYAGIAELAVHKGKEVSAGQALGKLYSDPADGGRTRLHFEVRHEKDKLNPADWLR